MKASVVRLVLPWPLSVNLMYRSVRGRSILSSAGRDYRTRALHALIPQPRPATPLQDRLSVTITAYPPDRRRRDLDNLPKGVLDLLTHGGVYADDSQIDRLLIVRGPVERGGTVTVDIEVLV